MPNRFYALVPEELGVESAGAPWRHHHFLRRIHRPAKKTVWTLRQGDQRHGAENLLLKTETKKILAGDGTVVQFLKPVL